MRILATPPLVTFVSPCSCHNVQGKGRWSVKHDPSTPPTDASTIQAVTPSNMFSWPSLDVPLTMQSERNGIEKPRGLLGLSVISVVPYAGCFRTQTAEMRAIVEHAITDLIDEHEWQKLQEIEDAERESLAKICIKAAA
jgi:hypothetical protein